MAYFARFDQTRKFGVEIEAFGVPKWAVCNELLAHGIAIVEASKESSTSSRWKIVNDDSISGYYSFEIVSPPLQGEEGLLQVEVVLGVLKRIRCEVNFSCGFHVHWDCSDFTGKNMLSILRLYAKFESVIDYLVAPSRRANANTYCQSLVKEGGISWVSSLVPNEQIRAREVAQEFQRKYANRTLLGNRRNASRRHKVNVTAYLEHGTVEFRQHQGTLDSEKAINWILFTQQLVNKAKDVTISHESSAKATLGELLRVLKLVDHEFIRNQCVDIRILVLPRWLKKRYQHFRSLEKKQTSSVLAYALENDS